MAGNIVKWWKHKILGGYKQFSVQECTTDSEELMYHQVRASSSCSAPPDLLMVSDRENNIPLRSPAVNIIGTTTAPATTTTSPSSGINTSHITSATNNNQRHNQKLLHHHHHQQQQQQQQQQPLHQQHQITAQQLLLAYNGTKDIGGNGKHQKQSSSGTGIGNVYNKQGQQQQDSQPQHQQQHQQATAHDIEGQMETQPNNHSSTRHAHYAQYQQQHQQQHQQQQQQQQPQRVEDHIRLEEFTCDVSVEGGKSSQPLQFSFTFYDLDGHHGKITKDDIVGIVYTIYESIGKSVVVPHSGSKTINVRLTVSPEGKSKSAAKNKKMSSNSMVINSTQQKSASISQAARRQHRYRPRKLIKSDEEDDDSNSEKERENTQLTSSNLAQVLANKSATKSHKLNKLKSEQQQCCTPQSLPSNATEIPNSPLETIYDNLKAPSATTHEACRECLAAVDESPNTAISPTTQYPANKSSTPNEVYMKHVASTRIKMLRKSRKQKHQDCMETRQRSLSVGSEACWKNRHLQKQSMQQQLLWHAEHQLNHNGSGDVVDGVQLHNSNKANSKSSMGAQKRNSAECWKTALNRNDLISIIRESMEKNRLCFQLNGKPQVNVSPIRHSQIPTQHHQQHQQISSSSSNNKNSQLLQTSQQRQRSNTVSKIPTLIANHNNVHSVSPNQLYYPTSRQRSSSCVNTISSNNNSQHDTSLHEHYNSANSSNNIYHQLQPHIPIYHQQMSINPAVIAAHNALLSASSNSGHHSKMNLCGYDSFLHATICDGGLSHSPISHPSATNQATITSTPAASNIGHQHQQIATVQPIVSANTTQNIPKHLGFTVTPNQIKTSKILSSGSYAETHHQHQSQIHNNTAQNSPQYHGYQRLPSSSKHNLSALHLLSPAVDKPPLNKMDKWRRDQTKSYDQLLYTTLSEKLQQTNLVSGNAIARESNQRRKHRILRQRRANALMTEANNVSLSSKISTKEDSEYTSIIHIDGDPVECENLLGPTSDEESHSQHELSIQQAAEQLVHDDTTTTNTTTTTSSSHVAEATLVDLDDGIDGDLDQAALQIKHSLNADPLLSAETRENDGLEIDAVLDEGLDEAGITESDRNSIVSNNSNNANATLANTTATNPSGTTSSSLIHRYVHEHIHHHYHHFQEKEE